jgi:hypothetical protein
MRRVDGSMCLGVGGKEWGLFESVGIYGIVSEIRRERGCVNYVSQSFTRSRLDFRDWEDILRCP